MLGASMVRMVAIAVAGLGFAAYACFAALPAATDARLSSSVWPAKSVSASLALKENTSRIARRALTTPGFADPVYDITTRAILAREPTAFDAMAVRALALDEVGREADTLRRMTAVNAVYRRSDMTNSWLIQHRLAQGELAPALDQLDQMLRTVGEQRSSVLTILAPVLAAPEAREPLVRILRGRPEWEPNFWYAVTRNPAATRNGLILRSVLTDRASLRDSNQDAELIQRGVEQRLFEESGTLYSALTGTRNLARLRSPQFDTAPKFPPFDWQLMRGEGLNASIDSARSRLHIYAGPTGTGTAATQIVRLPPGRYTLGVQQSADARESGDDGVTVRVRCLTGDSTILAETAANRTAAFSVPPDCNWQDVAIDVDFAATARDIVIDAVVVAPIA